MAVTTTLSTLFYGDARTDPVATITRVFTVVTTNTLSSGDVIFHPFWRIPNHAIITSVKVGGATVDGTNIINPVLRYYDSASAATDVSFGTLTLSVVTRVSTDTIATTLPYTFSASDDAAVHFAHLIIKAQAAVSGTGSTSINVIVQYVMNK
jgi:hypothetical protein